MKPDNPEEKFKDQVHTKKNRAKVLNKPQLHRLLSTILKIKKFRKLSFLSTFGTKTNLITNLTQSDMSLFIVFMTKTVYIQAFLLLKY